MYQAERPALAELPGSGKLLRSTAWAALVAAGLLVTAVLPAEYGIDPTGIGRLLGLTRMGEIKLALSKEAASAPPPATSANAAMPTIPASPEAAPASAARPAAAAASPPPVAPAVPAPGTTAQPAPSGKADAMSLSLKPGQAAEIKLDMRKGGTVAYQWSVTGGTLNVDAHGDPVNPPKGFYHGYGKGKQLKGDAGKLVAAFDGQHGWYWRNRSDAEVTLKLNTQGEYAAIKRVL